MGDERRGTPRTTLSLLLALTLAAGTLGLLAGPVAAQDVVPQPVEGAFEVTADAAGADVDFSWQVVESVAAWQLEAIGPEDENIALRLGAEDGTAIDETRGTGRAALLDLALEPGNYRIKVPRSSRESLPFTLRALVAEVAYDPEPNDSADHAVPLVPGVTATGRLADASGDVDLYRLDMSDPQQLLDIELIDATGTERRLCLLDDDGRDRQCRNGPGGASLPDLSLEAGPHLVRVSGSSDGDAPYQLRATISGERRPDHEAEPNDDTTVAYAIDSSMGVSGRSARSDPDYFSVTIEGEPRLWRWQASGPDILEFAWVDAGAAEIEATKPVGAGEPAVLTDLLLGAGTHRFFVRTEGGPYQIDATVLGPPDPDAEREPNSDPVRAEPYRIGQRRSGRLPVETDLDFLRFTVAAPERLVLRLEQPPDGDIDVRLSAGSTELLRRNAAAPGEPIEVDLRLDPGDYLVRLAPRQVSDAPYAITIDRGDPFVVLPDEEPNDSAAMARPAPSSLSWASRGSGVSDSDWYRLPPLGVAGEVSIETGGERVAPRLFAGPDAAERIDLDRTEPGRYMAAEVPPDVPLYLQIEAVGDYEVSVDSSGWPDVAAARPPSVEASLTLEGTEVAAYWPEAQRVAGTLTLANTGSDAVELDLEAVTSHLSWMATPSMTHVVVPPGESVSIPLTVHVAPDAWADEPVRVTIAARDDAGGTVTAAADLVASTTSPAQAPYRGWTVPDELLGGLNVASIGLGAVPLGTIDLDRELFLFDGQTSAGGGFGKGLDELPADLAVDLAGDAPLPIVGTIINPLARSSLLQETPQDFELLLSTDGQTWQSVLRDRILPLPADQSFVLDEPVLATHAMLRIHSLYTGRTRTMALGEWKVIAEPGVVPEALPRNIAAPARGGRVVRRGDRTSSFSYQTEMIDGDPKRHQVSLDREALTFGVVIGFIDGRAAQIEELRWSDPEGSDADRRLERVDVEVSVDGSAGPWQPIGEWRLARDAAGEVEPLVLDEPVWARYVRLSTTLAEEDRAVELPSAIEVIERATDDQYRPVLAEWGDRSSNGPLEWMMPVAPGGAGSVGPDAGDTVGEAVTLSPDEPRTETAQVLEDVDWFHVDVPDTDNTLTLEVTGVPSVGVRASLFDAEGRELPVVGQPTPGGGVSYEAAVEPGGGYDILVEQPPFNVVFTFDTSGSIGPFQERVMEGLREFAADVRSGRESALIIPFEQDPLLDDWEDRPDLLVDAVNGFDPRAGSSSNAVTSILRAAEAVAARDGLRAILIVTDAETGGLDLLPDVWRVLDESQAVVYAVHVGGTGNRPETRNLMQSWAHANAGSYTYPTTQAEMDRSFERMSTQLRRPSQYTLTAATSEVNREPAHLTVVAPTDAPAALAPGVGVEIILDTSGSMREKLGRRSRIDIAKASLRTLFGEALPEGVPLALRTFGGPGKGKAARCQTRLTQPLEELRRARALKLVKQIRAVRGTRTPLAASISEVADDLADVDGPRIVVLVTDGDETCGGDPDAALAGLRDVGFDVTVNIVGFALDDDALKERMAGWADAGGGTYFDAAVAEELAAAIVQATSAPFRVYAGDDVEAVAQGSVGGPGVSLPPGTYRVDVLADPPLSFDDVMVQGGTDIELRLDEMDG